MARKIETFISTIAREGEHGSVRGKIPAGLIKAINAKEGDGVEFQVHGTTLVGAQVLSGKALRIALKEKGQTRRATATSTKKVTKSSKVGKVKRRVVEDDEPVARGKKAKPAKKASKRRTEVEYEVPVQRKSKGKKFKLGKKKK